MYWLVSLPVDERESTEDVWGQLQDLTTYKQDLSVNSRFSVPEFRVGTLDVLLGLSDDLAKISQSVEGTVNKTRRALYDLASAAPSGVEPVPALVEGLTPEAFLLSFSWEEAKYPARRPLKETLASISETAAKLDDDLKLRSSEYAQRRAQLQALLRRKAGALPVRDLTDLVPEKARVETEHLTTVGVVVSKQTKADFLASYETLAERVVPRSASQIAEDGDHVAFSVVLFRKILDDFKQAARAKGFAVKDLEEPAKEAAREQAVLAAPGRDLEASPASSAEAARAELETARATLEAWAVDAHSEAYTAWVHVLAVRIFVESVLRYGLPPRFLPALIKPTGKSSVKVRKILADHWAGPGSKFFTATADAGPGDAVDAYPYVSFTLSVDEQ